MNKKLVGLALGVVAAPAAFAQSNVTIYGVVDAAYVYERNSDTGEDANGIQSGMSRSSRFGLKGSEDIGNGLKVLWVLEQGVKIDTGNEQHPGKAFGRQSYVALNGGFGTVGLGRQYTPDDGFNSYYDPFDHQFHAQASNLMKALQVRADNSVKYVSPVLSGLQATLIYGFGEQTNQANNYASGGLMYNNGPVSVGATATAQRDVTDSFYAKKYQLGATYDFKLLKLYGLVQLDRDVNGSTPTKGAESRQWLVGANAPVSQAGKVMVSYVREDDRDDANNDAHMWAVGYTHDLSKRTTLYTAYAHLTNKNDAAFALGTPQSGNIVAGANRGFSLGIRHSF